jgi:hypothetical protein
MSSERPGASVLWWAFRVRSALPGRHAHLAAPQAGSVSPPTINALGWKVSGIGRNFGVESTKPGGRPSAESFCSDATKTTTAAHQTNPHFSPGRPRRSGQTCSSYCGWVVPRTGTAAACGLWRAQPRASGFWLPVPVRFALPVRHTQLAAPQAESVSLGHITAMGGEVAGNLADRVESRSPAMSNAPSRPCAHRAHPVTDSDMMPPSRVLPVFHTVPVSQPDIQAG